MRYLTAMAVYYREREASSTRQQPTACDLGSTTTKLAQTTWNIKDSYYSTELAMFHTHTYAMLWAFAPHCTQWAGPIVSLSWPHHYRLA